MRSIKRKYKDNIGGSTRLLFVPYSSVDATQWPNRQGNVLGGDIVLKQGARWFFIDCVRESIDGSIPNRRNNTGSSYNHKATGFVSGDDKDVSDLFDRLTYGRFLVLRKDANGHWCLLGNIQEPLSFTFAKQTRNRATGLKGFDFEFSALCSLPELYYFGTIEFEVDNVNDTQIIPSVGFPGTSGSVWYFSSFPPVDGVGQFGDFYIELSTRIYVRTNIGWVLRIDLTDINTKIKRAHRYMQLRLA